MKPTAIVTEITDLGGGTTCLKLLIEQGCQETQETQRTQLENLLQSFGIPTRLIMHPGHVTLHEVKIQGFQESFFFYPNGEFYKVER